MVNKNVIAANGTESYARRPDIYLENRKEKKRKDT